MKQTILSLGKDSLIYGIGSVVLRFISMLLLPLFTTYLSPVDYGVIAMLNILTMVAHPVFSLGLSAAMGPSYFNTSDPKNKSRAVWTTFTIHLASGVLLLIAAWVFPAPIGTLVRLPAEYARLVSLKLTASALTILATALIERVQFEKQAKRYVAITFVTALTATLSSLYFVVRLEWGVYGVIAGALIGNAISLSAFFVLAWKANTPTYCPKMCKELLSLGLPLVPSFAFLFILMHSNKYILEWLYGLDAVGIYSIGFNFGTTISIITSGFATAYYPFFMSYLARQEEGREILARVFTYYILGVGVLCLLFFLFANPLVQLLTQPAFWSASRVVGLVAIAYYFQGAFNHFLPALYYTRDVKYVTFVQGGAAIAGLLITFVLVNSLNIVGAALGLAIGNLTMAMLMFWWVKAKPERYVQIPYDWKQLAMFGLLFVCVVSINQLTMHDSIMLNIFQSILGFVITIVLVFFLLDRRERSMILACFKH